LFRCRTVPPGSIGWRGAGGRASKVGRTLREAQSRFGSHPIQAGRINQYPEPRINGRLLVASFLHLAQGLSTLIHKDFFMNQKKQS
jgi:hypothetical protein